MRTDRPALRLGSRCELRRKSIEPITSPILGTCNLRQCTVSGVTRARCSKRELLAPVYGVTEGFETRDLKEAKALLEELAA